MVLRLLCVKRGLTVKFICDMVIGKMVRVQPCSNIYGIFLCELVHKTRIRNGMAEP
jgi:hypothetical protein